MRGRTYGALLEAQESAFSTYAGSPLAREAAILLDHTFCFDITHFCASGRHPRSQHESDPILFGTSSNIVREGALTEVLQRETALQSVPFYLEIEDEATNIRSGDLACPSSRKDAHAQPLTLAAQRTGAQVQATALTVSAEAETSADRTVPCLDRAPLLAAHSFPGE